MLKKPSAHGAVRSIGSVVAALLLWSPAIVTHAGEVLSPFAAKYLAKGAGLRAEMTVSLRSGESGSWIYQTETAGKGLAKLISRANITESSTFEFSDDQIRVSTYRLDDGSEKAQRDSAFDFDWDTSVARGTHEGEPRELELQPAVIDRNVYLLNLMLDFSNDAIPKHYEVVGNGAIKRYIIKIHERETVDTPAGQFEALKIEQYREGSSRSMLFWLAPQLSYLPVRIEQYRKGKRRSSAVLIESTGL